MAGSGTIASTDGTGTDASFSWVTGIALDNAGNLFVSDYIGQKIRKIVVSTGVVTTIAGGHDDNYDGQGTAAKFGIFSSICVDATGNLYAGDMSNGAIRKISPAGLVTDFAGITQSAHENASSDSDLEGDTDGALTAARFKSIASLYINSGNIFVSEWRGHRVRKIEMQ